MGTKVKRDIRYKVSYTDEYRFSILLKSLKHYNMKAYKDFVFYYLPYMRSGEFLADRLEDGTYRQYLKSDPVFEFVHGKLYIYYTVEDNIITLTKIEPEKFLEVGRKSMLDTYKGCPITSAKDKFLVDFFFIKNK